MSPTQHLIFVSIAKQQLFFYEDGVLSEVFAISTSRAKPSCVKDSLGTPNGLHFIDGKIGAGAHIDTVFKARVAVGKIEDEPAESKAKNLITTRIMRLRGLERGVNLGGNVDTYERYVYIHGTNHEERIGTPDSHGCVLMRRADIIRLFDVVTDGTIVLISLE